MFSHFNIGKIAYAIRVRSAAISLYRRVCIWAFLVIYINEAAAIEPTHGLPLVRGCLDLGSEKFVLSNYSIHQELIEMRAKKNRRVVAG